MSLENRSRRDFLKGVTAVSARAALLPAMSTLQAAGLRSALAVGLRTSPYLAGMLATFIAQDATAAGASVPFRVYNPHTEEKIQVDLFTAGEWNPKSVIACHWLFRDWRETQVVQIDQRLYAALYVLQRYFNPDGFVQINSGFRTEKTNEMLRRMGYKAAPESFHLKGRASDITIANATVADMARVAQLFRLGGLGQYKNFLHIDSGPVGRIWFG
jgi:uncharacterized protein YcbK (DUF882 family)